MQRVSNGTIPGLRWEARSIYAYFSESTISGLLPRIASRRDYEGTSIRVDKLPKLPTWRLSHGFVVFLSGVF